MSDKISKDTSNVLAIMAMCGLVWLFVGWRWALGLFLGLVLVTHLTLLFKKNKP